MRSPICRCFPALPALAALLPAQANARVFDAPVVVGDQFTRFEAVCDFDGDGHKDLLSLWYPPGSSNHMAVAGWHNDGVGNFSKVWSVQELLAGSTLNQSCVAVGDLDADGRDDFVFSIGGTHRYFISQGLQAPTLVTSIGATSGIKATMLLDQDGDGRADLVAAGATDLELLLTRAAPPFPTSSVPLTAGSQMLFAIDADGVGRKDIGLASWQSSTTIQMFSASGGVLVAGASFSWTNEFAPAPAPGDFDNDGDEDVVVFGSNGAYRVLRRTGPSTFVFEPLAFGGPATHLADIDGDGDLDGVCCGGSTGVVPQNTGPSFYEFALNDGGQFARAEPMLGLGSRRLAGVVDLNGDGRSDLVGGRCIYFPDGPLAGAPVRPLEQTFHAPRGVVDVDSDGDPDLDPGHGGQFFKNSGDGTFVRLPGQLPVASPGNAYRGPGWPGDFDGDGDDDLVVALETTGGVFLSMRLFENRGGGFFDVHAAAFPGVDFRIGTSVNATMRAEDSLVLDVEGDGDVDLVVRAWQQYSSFTRLYINDGSGVFTAGQSVAGVYATAFGRIDADGLLDMLAVYGSGQSMIGPLRLLRGTQPGAFDTFAPALAQDLKAGDSIALRDLDRDGDLDLVMPSHDVVLFAANDGNGGFTPVSGTPTIPLDWVPNAARTVGLEDVDGDGIVDLIAGPAAGTGNVAVNILPGTATPWAFAAATVQTLQPPALVDIDGDGDLDAVNSHVTRNRTWRGTVHGARKQYGVGLGGSWGIVPTLGAAGPFRLGQAGSLRIGGAVGGTAGIVGVGFRQVSQPLLGGTLLADPIVVIPVFASGFGNAPGEGRAQAPWFDHVSLTGVPLYYQAALLDPFAAQSVSLTNGLVLTVGL